MRGTHGKELKQLMVDSQQEIEVLSLASCKELNATNKQVSLEGNPSLAKPLGENPVLGGYLGPSLAKDTAKTCPQIPDTKNI